MSKILSLYGSPHRRGLSSNLHDIFLKNFPENITINKYHLYELDISPCIGCGTCKDKSICFFNDDMDLLYKELRSADLITISWPLYFSSLPSPLKAMIDRSQLLWEEVNRNEFPIRKREYLYFITAGSDYKKMFDPSTMVIRHLMNTLGYSENINFSKKINNLDSEVGMIEYKKNLEIIEKLDSNNITKFL